MAVIRFDELDAGGAVTAGGDDTMGAGAALGSPVLEKMTVELSGFEGDAAGLTTGIPVLEKTTVELSGFEGDAAGLTTGIPVLEKITVELSGFEGNCVCIAAGAEGETAGDDAIGPGATNIAVVLLVGGITGTGVDGTSVAGATTAEVGFGGGVTDAAGGSVTAGTTAARDATLEVEAIVAGRAVAKTGGTASGGPRLDAGRAVVKTGGPASGGPRLDAGRAVVMTGSTVPITPSIIVIVV